MSGAGTYGGGQGFDLESLYFHQQQQQQQQHQQQQQQQQPHRRPQQQQQQQHIYGLPAPCFDGYDPHQNMGLHTGIAYNPTTHIYVPSPQTAQSLLPTILEPVPLASGVVQRHQQGHQTHYASPVAYGLVDSMSTADKLMSSSMGDQRKTSYDMHMNRSTNSPTMSSYASLFSNTQAEAARKENTDVWLDSLKINVSGMSLVPLTGSDILKRVRGKTDDVVTRYLPCVDFLVSCQQELRAGLQAATQKRLYRSNYRDSMTPKQFYTRYLGPLPDKFYNRNKTLMESTILHDAYNYIKKLCEDARQVEFQGCEVMKNAFLGGMKDGESWGLRKWLSTHGGALEICNTLECILNSCQKMDRSEESTTKLSERLRPLAKQALDRLKNDVPASYQEVSTAHPYLPFFHRLESALKGMSNFDPEDDDVICLDDDDEIEEEKKKAAANPNKRSSASLGSYAKRMRLDAHLVAHSFDDDDDDSVEVVCQSPTNLTSVAPKDVAGLMPDEDWICPRCTMLNPADVVRCCMCDKTLSTTCDTEDEAEATAFNKTFADLDANKNFADLESFDDTAGSVSASEGLWDATTESQSTSLAATPRTLSPLMQQNNFDGIEYLPNAEIIQRLEKLAQIFEVNQQEGVRPPVVSEDNFWDMRLQYSCALRLFAQVLRNIESQQLLHPVNENHHIQIGRPPYSSIIKHPLCFLDIIGALFNGVDAQSHGDGQLPIQRLQWNMWRGMDLLHAIDLVFLNYLAYNGKERTKERSQTNKLRKTFWDGITGIIASRVGPDVEKRRQLTPTRRGVCSGFVVRK